jgi:hypothetical protein
LDNIQGVQSGSEVVMLVMLSVVLAIEALV